MKLINVLNYLLLGSPVYKITITKTSNNLKYIIKVHNFLKIV